VVGVGGCEYGEEVMRKGFIIFEYIATRRLMDRMNLLLD
jgi:hypothetical protein